MLRLYTVSPGLSLQLLMTVLSPVVALGSSTKSCKHRQFTPASIENRYVLTHAYHHSTQYLVEQLVLSV
jgi:hypothetical protein